MSPAVAPARSGISPGPRSWRIALQAYAKAIELDPKFARAYAGIGVIQANHKELKQAQASFEKALSLLDRMTERERLRTLGSYYNLVALNYVKAIETYEALVKRWPADDIARSNLSLAYLYTGNVPRALEHMRETLRLNPRSSSDRYNLAIMSVYAGDFDGGIAAAELAIKDSPDYEQPYLPLASAKLLRGDSEGARSTYEQVTKLEAGVALGRFGLVDLLLYGGRSAEALTALRKDLAADEKNGSPGAVRRAELAIAEAAFAVGQRDVAVKAARKAVATSQHESVLTSAALLLVNARDDAAAMAIATQMEDTLQEHMKGYSELVRGAIAARDKRYPDAVQLLRSSTKHRETWLARLMLARVYVETERYAEALGELDLCEKRRGEATDAFFYDYPTARYLPPLYYYLGRAHEALRTGKAAEYFDRFLAIRVGGDPGDSLVTDAMQRRSKTH